MYKSTIYFIMEARSRPLFGVIHIMNCHINAYNLMRKMQILINIYMICCFFYVFLRQHISVKHFVFIKKKTYN